VNAFHVRQMARRWGCVLLCGVTAGCATASPQYDRLPPQAIPQANGTYYLVQPGETLWGIAHDFGLDLNTLAMLNRLLDPTQLNPGQRLFLPAPPPTRNFLWPARGAVTPGQRSAVRPINGGLEIQAAEGSFVRASRTGRVAVAAREVSGLGKTVILDHGDGYATVYAGLTQLLVVPGAEISQGNPVGRLGRAPLYFEIRANAQPSDPSTLLP